MKVEHESCAGCAHVRVCRLQGSYNAIVDRIKAEYQDMDEEKGTVIHLSCPERKEDTIRSQYSCR